jgi:hypothetical protein
LDQTKELRKARFFLIASVVVLVAAVTLIVLIGIGREKSVQKFTTDVQSFELLNQQVHKITSAEVRPQADGQTYAVRVNFEGFRAGNYTVVLSGRDSTYQDVSVSETQEVSLASGAESKTFTFDPVPLIKLYHQVVLDNANVTVSAQGYFTLTVSVEPDLTSEEKSRLPSFELHNLQLGNSQLKSSKRASLAIDFDIRGNTYHINQLK